MTEDDESMAEDDDDELDNSAVDEIAVLDGATDDDSADDDISALDEEELAPVDEDELDDFKKAHGSAAKRLIAFHPSQFVTPTEPRSKFELYGSSAFRQSSNTS